MTPPTTSSGDEPTSGKQDRDPRVSYANERTFLAWIRTSLALTTAGLAITQLLPAFKVAGGRRVIGLPLIALGIVTAGTSFRQWDRNERAIRSGKPPSTSHLPALVASSVAVIATVALILAGVGKVGK